jgi:hypothetical protein
MISEPALHVLVFARLTRGAGEPSRGLSKVWAAASALGITEAIDVDIPVELPAELSAEDVFFRIIAAKSDTVRRDTAIAFAAHDVAAVAVQLRPTPDVGGSEDALHHLSEKWRRALDPGSLDDVFGTAEVLTGVADQPATDLPVTAGDSACKVLAAHGDSGLELSTVVEPGIALWTMELPWGRRVVALADTVAAPTFGAWFSVSRERDDAGQLVRYFMHSSKLHYEAAVFKEGIGDLRKQERALDDGLADWFAMHERFDATGAAADELIDAQSRLGRAQGDAAGLLISITHLRDLRRSVEIAAHNLRANEPPQIASATIGTSPFARELKLAEWLDNQTGHEIAYLESCRERVEEAQKLTDLRLQQLAAANARTANWLTVLQTSLVAASLGTLGVATTLGTHFSAPVTVRAAVMALVASTTLFLPLLAIRWTNGYRWPELAAVAVIGGCAGWVVTVIVSAATPLVTVLAAVIFGAVLLGCAAALANYRRLPRVRPPKP